MLKLYVSLRVLQNPLIADTHSFRIADMFTTVKPVLTCTYVFIHYIADRSFQISTSRCLIPGILGIPLYS